MPGTCPSSTSLRTQAEGQVTDSQEHEHGSEGGVEEWLRRARIFTYRGSAATEEEDFLETKIAEVQSEDTEQQ